MQHTVSSKTLIKAFASACIVAVVALITVILPAEYNIDPTGFGSKFGLTRLAQGNETDVQTDLAVTATQEFQVIEVTVPEEQGLEYKFSMQQYNKMIYEWMSDGTPLYFDLHGEPEGDTTGYFESYTIATSDEMKGSFTAPFTGSHGWYWKNTSDKPVTVLLLVKGQYEVIGLK